MKTKHPKPIPRHSQATFAEAQGTPTQRISQASLADCRVCGLPVGRGSLGGPDICPTCDIGVYRDGSEIGMTDHLDAALLRRLAREAVASPHRGVGRPSLRRNECLEVRLTKGEKERIVKAAKRNGLSVSVFVRLSLRCIIENGEDFAKRILEKEKR